MSLYECPFCREQVNTISRLKWHLNQHHKKDIPKNLDYLNVRFLLNLTGCDHNDRPTSELKRHKQE